MKTSKGPSGTVKSAPSSIILHSTAANSVRCHATPEHPCWPQPPGSTECVYRGHLPSSRIQYKPLLPAEEEPLSFSAHSSCSCLLLLCTLTPVWILLFFLDVKWRLYIKRGVTLRHSFGQGDQSNRGTKESNSLATFHAVTALFTQIAPCEL